MNQSPSQFQSNSMATAADLDRSDPLSDFREQFHLPDGPSGKPQVYFLGNSLGLQPKRTADYVREELDRWRSLAVRGHFEGEHPWMPYHQFLAAPMAQIVGARPEEVVVMNSLTANLHCLMATFYQPTPLRHKILVEARPFPSDIYAVESQIRWNGFDPSSSIVSWQPRGESALLHLDDLAELVERHHRELALLLLPGVHFYSGQALDMAEITRIAHRHEIPVGLDLAHAAGNLPLHLHDWDVDFAVWCCYKYLNSGPGAPGGCYIHQRHASNTRLRRLAGWWGHTEKTRFAMDNVFDPTPTAEGWQWSNPPILAMAAIRASLDVFAEAGFMPPLRSKSIQLTQHLYQQLMNNFADRVQIITPASAAQRGCQLSIRVGDSQTGRRVHQQLEQQGVMTDFREPDVIRAAPVPLYNSFADVDAFVTALARCLDA